MIPLGNVIIDKTAPSPTVHNCPKQLRPQLSNNKNMPAHKLGRLWKFKISGVDAWVQSGGGSDLERGGF
jgi:hypothetical protein